MIKIKLNYYISFTASSGYDGIYFKRVAIDSEAYSFGFREEDLLRELNGKKVMNISDIENETKLQSASILSKR